MNTYKTEITGTIKNGVFCYINNVKADFIAHQYRIDKIETQNGIRMLSLEDIGAMKLNAILQNGTRLKDFVDIYSLLEHVPLYKLTDTFEKKYPDVNRQMAHTALLYHKDVNLKQKIDFIGREIKWPEIAGRIHEAVTNTQKMFQKEDQSPDLKKSEKLRQNKSKNRGNRPRL